MLHRQAVPTGTLDLLIQLSQSKPVEPFFLVGETALALRFGHRLSVDLDFFTRRSFSSKSLATKLGRMGQCVLLVGGKNSLQVELNRVKLDFVTYRYPLLDPVAEIEGIRMLGLRDIVAMKLAAVVGRGAKKDFFDIAELLRHFTLREMIGWHHAKFPVYEHMLVLRSLGYTEDAETTPTPESLNGMTWDAVKKTVTRAVTSML